jgi:hypothetical protein
MNSLPFGMILSPDFNGSSFPFPLKPCALRPGKSEANDVISPPVAFGHNGYKPYLFDTHFYRVDKFRILPENFLLMN